MLPGPISLFPPQLPLPGSPVLADVSTQKGPRCEVFKSTYRLFQGIVWLMSNIVACIRWSLGQGHFLQPGRICGFGGNTGTL